MPAIDPFGARAPLGPGLPDLYRLAALGDRLDLGRAPVTVKILLENVLRHAGGGIVGPADVETLAAWRPGVAGRGGDPVHAGARHPPGLHRRARRSWTSRSCATRWPTSAATRRGSTRSCRPTSSSTTPSRSTAFGTPAAFAFNVEREYERNGERYQLLRWAQTAFRDLRVVPPGTGHRPPGQPRVPGDGRDRRPTATAAAGSPSPTRSSGPTRTRR